MFIDWLKIELLNAQKSKNVLKTDVYRYLLSELKNKEIELRPQGIEFNDEACAKVIKKLIKKGDDAILQFKTAGREDLVSKEQAQVDIFKQLQAQFFSTIPA